MDLKWWPILVGGVVCLAVGIIAAWQLPVQRVQRRLRPLAHVDRLTRLPEFARVQRVYRVSMAISAAMLGIAFLSAIMAAARPVQAASDAAGYDARIRAVRVTLGASFAATASFQLRYRVKIR